MLPSFALAQYVLAMQSPAKVPAAVRVLRARRSCSCSTDRVSDVHVGTVRQVSYRRIQVDDVARDAFHVKMRVDTLYEGSLTRPSHAYEVAEL